MERRTGRARGDGAVRGCPEHVVLAADDHRRFFLRHLEMIGAVLELLPEGDVGIEPVLRQILGGHAEGIGLQLDFALAAAERIARDRIDVGDLLVGHREAACRRTDAVHHHRTASAPQGAVVSVGIADVEGEIIVGVRIHLPGGDRVEALGHLHVALARLRTELTRPAAHRIGLEQRVMPIRLHLPEFELGLFLVSADHHRRRRRRVDLRHLGERGARDRLLGTAGAVVEIGIVTAGEHRPRGAQKAESSQAPRTVRSFITPRLPANLGQPTGKVHATEGSAPELTDSLTLNIRLDI